MIAHRALLFVNGEPPHHFPSDLTGYHYVACTDGAYHNYLASTAIIPDFIIGDLDSYHHTMAVPDKIQIIQTPDQNKTDFEKAIIFLADKGIQHFDIYGATGHASDHFLGNLSVALQYHSQYQITFHDNYGHFFFAKKYQEIVNINNHIVSFIPFCEVTDLTITGVQYPLVNQTLTFGKFISVRNKAISDLVKITFQQGNLIIFIEDFSSKH